MIPTYKKDGVLELLADLLDTHKDDILAANQKDVAAYTGGDESMLDRLKVDEKKIQGMITAVHEAQAMGDPEGKVLYTFKPENGLQIENRTVPFGKILIIYESRPDVTIEAAITAFKAGNKILLKGGKEARNTNKLLTTLWHEALEEYDLDPGYVTYLDMNREETQALIKTNSHKVDLIIPRGGEGLINFVHTNTDIPTIISGRGNNFLFVDEAADMDMAMEIVVNGKSRISVCNALDKVLIYKNLPGLQEKLSKLVERLNEHQIEIIGDDFISGQFDEVAPIQDMAVYEEEFLAPKIMLAMVDTIDEAISLINTHSGKHSACIVTADAGKAEQFLNEVDCAAVYHNASTRFTDGGQFGFGAEMAISTQKVHFRGPIGINQLVTNKWFIYGNGQIRS